MQALLRKPRSWYHEIVEVFRTKDVQARRDRNLAIRIADVFEEALAPSDVESLSFYVREGSVTVFGTICHPQSRAFIVELIRRVPEVEEVNDHVQVVDYAEVF